LRRDEEDHDSKGKDEKARKNRALCLLRAFAVLLLDSAAGQGLKGRQRKSCVRLLKVALKAAKVCIEGKELSIATKVLERAAEYQDILSKEDDGASAEVRELVNRLRIEYFAVRTTLVSTATPAGVRLCLDIFNVVTDLEFCRHGGRNARIQQSICLQSAVSS
jgi:hypothetical protein